MIVAIWQPDVQDADEGSLFGNLADPVRLFVPISAAPKRETLRIKASDRLLVTIWLLLLLLETGPNSDSPTMMKALHRGVVSEG